MFEEGVNLKKRHGEKNVFDFSLGNPDLEPPALFTELLQRTVNENLPGRHGYMPNAGYPETREAVASSLSREHGVPVSKDEVVMTCGAGGGLNVVLKTLLDPGEEIIILVPYFVEYLFYVGNHGGCCTPVKTRGDCSLDLSAIESAISSRTKGLILNSPHNPTGRVYDQESVGELGRLLQRKSSALGKTIYLIADEPYGKILYDGKRLPSIFQSYSHSIIVSSYSKDMSL